ncbi:MAG: RDD family protein [Dehalococcoidia bacterium]
MRTGTDRAAVTSVAVPAPLAPRLAAFILDMLTGAGLIVLFSAFAWLWWLASSSGGTRQPSDAAIYAGLVVATLALPLWAGAAVFGLSRWGQTPGLAAMALRVLDRSGNPPDPIRALVRVLALGVATLAAVLTPLLIAGAIAAAAQRTLPPIVAVVAALPPLLVVGELICCAASKQRRSLHDFAAGTRVVRVTSPRNG